MHKNSNSSDLKTMFTGIIQELGTVQKIEKQEGLTRITFLAPKILSANKKKTGDSIAVDGCCLSITHLTQDTFTAEAIPETLKKTIIETYSEGTKINLESPVKVGDTLDGHMVQGHIDFTSTAKSTKQDGGSLILGINFAIEQSRFLALKGSVTINGVSLTISYLGNDYLEVSLIPETINNTNLSLLTEGSQVNIEIDLIARYLDRLLEGKEKEIKYSFLKQRKFYLNQKKTILLKNLSKALTNSMRINTSQSDTALDGKDLKITIILSRFNDSLGNVLLENTLETLKKLNVLEKNIQLMKVPGALELPLVAKFIATKEKPDAIIALGIVIKGDTSHYDHVCNETHRGLMKVSLKTETPIVFGVITAFTEKQAADRVQKNKLNKGKEYAETAIEMALLKRELTQNKSKF